MPHIFNTPHPRHQFTSMSDPTINNAVSYDESYLQWPPASSSDEGDVALAQELFDNGEISPLTRVEDSILSSPGFSKESISRRTDHCSEVEVTVKDVLGIVRCRSAEHDTLFRRRAAATKELDFVFATVAQMPSDEGPPDLFVEEGSIEVCLEDYMHQKPAAMDHGSNPEVEQTLEDFDALRQEVLAFQHAQNQLSMKAVEHFTKKAKINKQMLGKPRLPRSMVQRLPGRKWLHGTHSTYQHCSSTSPDTNSVDPSTDDTHTLSHDDISVSTRNSGTVQHYKFTNTEAIVQHLNQNLLLDHDIDGVQSLGSQEIAYRVEPGVLEMHLVEELDPVFDANIQEDFERTGCRIFL